MSKRGIAEILLWVLLKFSKFWIKKSQNSPDSIFILRNNGLGDLLCVTPLFQMLKQKFPNAKIYVGVGYWHEDLLANNPNIAKSLQVNAPWHNQFNGTSNIFSILKYIFFSEEVKTLSKHNFNTAFDVVGSAWGSLLFLRLSISQRIGVDGYDGGHSSNNLSLIFDPQKHVAQSAIDMGRLLQIEQSPEPRPQVFLTKKEIDEAESNWGISTKGNRLVLAPGGSFPEKCWVTENFQELLEMILKQTNTHVRIIGGKEDENKIYLESISLGDPSRLSDLSGKRNLRQTAAIIATSDWVVCNTSLPMHLAGAFTKPCLTLLGSWYDSAMLHHKQWGYPETIVSGKEILEGKRNITSVKDAFGLLEDLRENQ